MNKSSSKIELLRTTFVPPSFLDYMSDFFHQALESRGLRAKRRPNVMQRNHSYKGNSFPSHFFSNLFDLEQSVFP